MNMNKRKEKIPVTHVIKNQMECKYVTICITFKTGNHLITHIHTHWQLLPTTTSQIFRISSIYIYKLKKAGQLGKTQNHAYQYKMREINNLH